MDQEEFRNRVTDSLARLETNVALLVADVKSHRERLDKIERWQLRFGIAGVILLTGVAALGGKAAPLLKTVLHVLEKG